MEMSFKARVTRIVIDTPVKQPPRVRIEGMVVMPERKFSSSSSITVSTFLPDRIGRPFIDGINDLFQAELQARAKAAAEEDEDETTADGNPA